MQGHRRAGRPRGQGDQLAGGGDVDEVQGRQLQMNGIGLRRQRRGRLPQGIEAEQVRLTAQAQPVATRQHGDHQPAGTR